MAGSGRRPVGASTNGESSRVPPMNRFEREVAAIIELHRTAWASSARVLLTTVFGDSLRPRRQAISVQDLAGLVEPMGVNERLVRTSLQRMAAEGLVVAERVGRRAFYSVSPDAEDTFDSADQRFYARRTIEWDGRWTLVVVDPRGADSDTRTRLSRELGWLGMRSIVAGVLASPTIDPLAVEELARRVNAPLAALVRAPLESGTLALPRTMPSLAEPEAGLHEMYGRHIAEFTPVADAAGSGHLPVEAAFVARTLLIDGWRRIALRSTDLPAELLPEGWQADEAYRLTAGLYRAVRSASEAHLDAVLGPSASTAVTRFAD